MLQGTTQAVIFAGTPGADVAYGSSTNDNLSGAAANDELFGYAGNDTLNGGIGNDSLRGAYGNDTFVFDSTIAGGLNVDQVFGFVDGADRLLLDSSVFTTVNALGTTLTAAELLSAAGATAATTAAQRLIHNVTLESCSLMPMAVAPPPPRWPSPPWPPVGPSRRDRSPCRALAPARCSPAPSTSI